MKIRIDESNRTLSNSASRIKDGDVIALSDCEKIYVQNPYIAARISVEQVVLINLRSGNRWNQPKATFEEILGDTPFKFLDHVELVIS